MAEVTQLPTGTVTFLFTDIEGSTLLLRQLGDRYAALLAEHRSIVGRVLAREGGEVIDAKGDSFFAVFASPVAAVRAAIDMQRELASHAWPGGSDVRVRMGLHTGEGTPVGEGYVGLDVHRAARIGDAGHGGQVLLSGATKELVQHTLPEGAELVDLGDHRLKDMPHAERLYQLSIVGLLTEFPPLRTLDARPNNLPAQMSSFVGREEAVREVQDALEGTRLLTLTGPGGTGKTRLALEVGYRQLPAFDDGVWLVDLSAVTDPSVVPTEIAIAIGATRDPGEPVFQCLEEHLRDRKLLLILDNFEQVLDAALAVEHLLSHAPGLKILVTSRSVLSVYGEREYPVPPLKLPELGSTEVIDRLGRSESVFLFVERARDIRPDFQLTEENALAVAEICSRLDGLPLAIELAAVRVNVLSPQAMLPRLDERLALLTSGPRSLPERQRTLRGAIDWSYRLLEEPERRLFARLATFSGGGALEAIEAVADHDLGVPVLDVLGSLVDDSLLRRAETPRGEVRFQMLETIREYAIERLDEEFDAAEARRRHAMFFLGLAVRAEPHLVGADQKEWLDRFDPDHDNLRTALSWSIEAGEVPAGQEAAGALWRFWHQRGHLAEGRRRLEKLLHAPGGAGRTPQRFKALTGAGGLAYWQNDYPATVRFYSEALEIARELDEPQAVAEALDIYRELGNLFSTAESLAGLGSFYLRFGDSRAAAAAQREALSIFVEVGNPTGIATALEEMAMVETMEGRHERALLLAGAASALKNDVGGGPPAELMRSEEVLDESRRSLDPEAADAAWNEGAAMGIDKAIAFALERPDDPGFADRGG